MESTSHTNPILSINKFKSKDGIELDYSQWEKLLFQIIIFDQFYLSSST